MLIFRFHCKWFSAEKNWRFDKPTSFCFVWVFFSKFLQLSQNLEFIYYRKVSFQDRKERITSNNMKPPNGDCRCQSHFINPKFFLLKRKSRRWRTSNESKKWIGTVQWVYTKQRGLRAYLYEIWVYFGNIQRGRKGAAIAMSMCKRKTQKPHS